MQRALNENYFLCVQNKLIIMAGAETSWQGIERPQCGQHRLLSFARIIAVVTVAVVAKCFSVLFSFVILFVFGFFVVLLFFPACLCGAHYLWPVSATPAKSRLSSLRSGSSWLGLFLSVDTTSLPLPSTVTARGR